MPLDQTPARNTRPFLKAMGLALPIIVVIIVFAVTTEEDPTAAGELAGGLAVAPFLGGIAVGIWARLAPRRWHWPDYVLRFALCTVAFFGLNAIGQGVRRAATPAATVPVFLELTEAEKEDLHLSGGWIRHSKFDFTLPVGDKVDPSPQIQDEMNRQLGAVPGTYVWAFEDRSGGIIIVYVAKGPGSDRETFSALARGLGKGTSQHAAAVLEDVVRWDRGGREFRYAARLTDGQYTKVRCVPGPPDRNPPYVNAPYVVCVQTLSPDSTALSDARSHLKVHTATIH